MPIFGLMPDWNPVEMIAIFQVICPIHYLKLITDNSWSKAREK